MGVKHNFGKRGIEEKDGIIGGMGKVRKKKKVKTLKAPLPDLLDYPK